MTPADLGDLAESMVPVAERVVGAVHEDGPTAMANAIAGLSDLETNALIVVLAAMVNPDATPAQLLGWVDWDTPGHRPEAEPLFNVGKASARTWSDERCHELWMEYRRTNLNPARGPVAFMGYREWERRRKNHHRRTGANLTTQNDPDPVGSGQNGSREGSPMST